MEHDLELLSNENVDTVFAPSRRGDVSGRLPNYRHRYASHATTGGASPTHFEGVTTVVTKLFNLCRPTRACFGQKDAQQVAVLKPNGSRSEFQPGNRRLPHGQEKTGWRSARATNT